MTEPFDQKQESGDNFSFKNEPLHQPEGQQVQQEGSDYILKIQSQLDQDMKDLQKNSQNPKSDRSKLRGKCSQINSSQLERIKRYFRKEYQSFYFNNVQMKDLNYKQDSQITVKKYKGAFYLGQVNQAQQKQGMGILLYLSKPIEHYVSQPLAKIQYSRSYQGDFKEDKRDGKGCQTFPDGSVYKGDYKAGKPEGNGKFLNPDGQTYEGEWKAGIKCGKGFWKGLKGETYLGEWIEGRPQGYGVFVNEKGDRYQGQFKQFLKHGDGIERFTNGDMYKGSYQNGRPGGFGEYYWCNKSYFKGYFKNGLRCGKGLWKRGPGNCDKYEGQYENDKKWGYGVFTWANGNVYKGEYSGDLRNGYGQMYWRNGCYYKGQWKEGIQHGEGEIFIANQGLKRGLFENNEIVRIDHEELIKKQKDEDLQRQFTQQNEETNNVDFSKVSQKSLLKQSSRKSWNSEVKSKISKVSKPMTMIEKDSNRNDNQNPKFQTIKKHSKSREKILEQKPRSSYGIKQQSRMKSVPLKMLYQRDQATDPKKLVKMNTAQKDTPFRIQVRTSSNYVRTATEKPKPRSDSFDGKHLTSNIQFKKKDRLLHSSFYLYRYKNIGKPQKQSNHDVSAQNRNQFATVTLQKNDDTS